MDLGECWRIQAGSTASSSESCLCCATLAVPAVQQQHNFSPQSGHAAAASKKFRFIIWAT